MKLLGIESSCDETAAAVVEDGRVICSSVVASQIEEHKLYGGVVPEIASRKHIERINQVIEKCLKGGGNHSGRDRRRGRDLRARPGGGSFSGRGGGQGHRLRGEEAPGGRAPYSRGTFLQTL